MVEPSSRGSSGIRRADRADVVELAELAREYCIADGHRFDEPRVRRALGPLLDGDALGVVCALIAAAALLLSGCADDPSQAVVGIVAEGCRPAPVLASGAIVDDDLVLTAAHPIAGASAIAVIMDGRPVDGTVVAFDPDMDLAMVRLDVSPPYTPAGRLTVRDVDDARPESGDHGVAHVVRDGVVEAIDVTIRRPVNIRTDDIYLDADTERPGYELDADIRTGDSGGPVVVGGEIVGVLWATSRKFDDRAYAIDPVAAGSTLRRQLVSGELGDEIDLSRCGRAAPGSG